MYTVVLYNLGNFKMITLKWKKLMEFTFLTFVIFFAFHVFIHIRKLQQLVDLRKLISYGSHSQMRKQDDSIFPGQLKVFTRHNDRWERNTTVCYRYQQHFHKYKFHKVGLMSSTSPLFIYIFNPDLDWISFQITQKKSYDAANFEIMVNLVKPYKGTWFIDVGANIGVFTLQMAEAGIKVVAIETSHECIQHMCASLKDNNLTDDVTVVHNAISSNHNDVHLVIAKHDNFGIQFIDSEDTRMSVHRRLPITLFTNKTIQYKSVTLDDLLTLPNVGPNMKQAFIKMDVLGFEHKALKAAEIFFKKVHVLGVFMAWDKHFNHESGHMIVSFFTELKYEPYACDVGEMRGEIVKHTHVSCDVLEKEDMESDRADVMWLRPQILTTDRQ